MEQSANPVMTLLKFWMMLQLVAGIVLILGGIYVLYCLGRAAAGLDRMASAMETWVQLQLNEQSAYTPSADSPIVNPPQNTEKENA